MAMAAPIIEAVIVLFLVAGRQSARLTIVSLTIPPIEPIAGLSYSTATHDPHQ